MDQIKNGQTLPADRAYESDALHAHLKNAGVKANIRLMPASVKTYPLDRKLYKERNLIERCINKI